MPAKILSSEEASRVEKVFSTLKPGDLIEGQNFSLVVIRQIESMSVLGLTDPQKRTVTQILPGVYGWSKKVASLVNFSGEVPDWWSSDLQVFREESLNLSAEHFSIPVREDYHMFSRSEAEVLIDKNRKLLESCIQMLVVGPCIQSSVRRVLEEIGVTLTDEQNVLFYIATSNASIRKVLATSIGLVIEMGESSNDEMSESKQATFH